MPRWRVPTTTCGRRCGSHLVTLDSLMSFLYFMHHCGPRLWLSPWTTSRRGCRGVSLIPPRIGWLLCWYNVRRLDYRNFRSCIVATLNVEGPLGFYVGAYPFYMKMLVTCFLTTSFTNSVTSKWKREKGLKEW